jgi:hypothetical protein
MDNVKEKYWRKLIGLQESSGLSGMRFCKENNLRYHQYIYWLRKFSNKDKPSSSFLPVMLKPSSSIKIHAGSLHVEVDENFDEMLLKRLLACLPC